MSKEKNLIRQMYENELVGLKIEYEREVRNLMVKNKKLLTIKEQLQLKWLEKKINRYSIIGTTKGYKHSSE